MTTLTPCTNPFQRGWIWFWYSTTTRFLLVLLPGHYLLLIPVLWWLHPSPDTVRTTLVLTYALVFCWGLLDNDFSQLRRIGLDEYRRPLPPAKEDAAAPSTSAPPEVRAKQSDPLPADPLRPASTGLPLPALKRPARQVTYSVRDASGCLRAKLPGAYVDKLMADRTARWVEFRTHAMQPGQTQRMAAIVAETVVVVPVSATPPMTVEITLRNGDILERDRY